MFPKHMPNELRKLIAQTIEASQLEQTEKDELRRELESHILAHIYELEVAGRSEAEVIAEIKKAFGDTQEIGRELFYAHHKFENVPLVGPLLYYRPIRLGAKLFVAYLGMFFLVVLVREVVISPIQGMLTGVWMNNYQDVWATLGYERTGQFLNLIDTIQFGLYRLFQIAPFVLSALLGRWLYRKMQGSITHILETVLFSYIPFFLLVFVEVLYAIAVRGTTILDATALTVTLIAVNTGGLFLVPVWHLIRKQMRKEKSVQA